MPWPHVRNAVSKFIAALDMEGRRSFALLLPSSSLSMKSHGLLVHEVMRQSQVQCESSHLCEDI